jgi:hypothetical protein
VSYRDEHPLSERVLNAAESAGQSFAFYDRKEDEDLTREELEQAVRSGDVTMEEISSAFIQGARREGL